MIYRSEKAKHRQRELQAAEQAKENLKDKVPVRINARTVIYVSPAEAKKIRAEKARKLQEAYNRQSALTEADYGI